MAPNRLIRYLMLWSVIVLQTMTPFIHAHAGAVQISHASLIHAHIGAHAESAYHALAASERGAEIEVAPGMPSRFDAQGASAEAPADSPAILTRIDTSSPVTGLPAPPPLHLVSSDHTLPLALAPPSA
ncbi:MAG: hypothetical protein B7X93_06870 [Hydrogenophilales bacterium 17-61-9]|nr:MAG: hypothetical protein B7X93_06870 [Hydrogenophilales bacterium 17-61-9]